MEDTESETGPVVTEESRPLDVLGLAITGQRGPAWVLVSADLTNDGDGLNLKVEVGPILGVEDMKRVLRLALEGLA